MGRRRSLKAFSFLLKILCPIHRARPIGQSLFSLSLGQKSTATSSARRMRSCDTLVYYRTSRIGKSIRRKREWIHVSNTKNRNEWKSFLLARPTLAAAKERELGSKQRISFDINKKYNWQVCSYGSVQILIPRYCKNVLLQYFPSFCLEPPVSGAVINRADILRWQRAGWVRLEKHQAHYQR